MTRMRLGIRSKHTSSIRLSTSMSIYIQFIFNIRHDKSAFFHITCPLEVHLHCVGALWRRRALQRHDRGGDRVISDRSKDPTNVKCLSLENKMYNTLKTMPLCQKAILKATRKNIRKPRRSMNFPNLSAGLSNGLLFKNSGGTRHWHSDTLAGRHLQRTHCCLALQADYARAIQGPQPWKSHGKLTSELDS